MDELIYLDNAATTYPKPECVYDFMDKFNRETIGSYKRSNIENKGLDVVKETRRLLKDLFHVKEGYEVIIQSSATEAMNTVLRGIEWVDGMSVYITRFEHNATLRTIYEIEERFNINLYYLEMKDDKSGYDLEKIKSQFSNKSPDVLIMTHASNSFGLITPVEDIMSLIKLNDTITIIDGAQTAGLIDFNISQYSIDAFIFAGHKTLYGPYGVGGMIKRNTLKLKPLLTGGTGNNSISKTMPEDRTKYEAGTRNLFAIGGLYRSLVWMNDVKVKNIHEHEKNITADLIELLHAYEYLTVYHFDNQIGVISIKHNELSSDELGKILERYKIITRVGLQCAPLSHEFMDTSPDGTVRISISYFTNQEDLKRLKDALDEVEFLI
ncbi:MAG: aminotransferase class V-fold PLP-dependent enzyme [Clostridiales bacterium]|nr:aminotransferase class V-fold PLP-dependent enzyme [Clostridiales bacterium]